MKNSEQLLALYDELIVDKYNKVNADDKKVMQNRHDTYKNFIARVQVRTVELKNGKKLNYDESWSYSEIAIRMEIENRDY